MSSIVPLRCLLCKHLNPADAVFCNKCGTQLDLQACGRCGALNERVAQNCSQCGARLTVPAQPEPGSLLAPATSVKEATPAAPDDAAGAGPEAAPPRHDLAHSPPETQAVDDTFLSEMDAASLMWRKLEERTPDPAGLPEVAATRSRRRWLMLGAALLLALVVNFVYVYVRDQQPEQAEQKAAQGERQAAPDVPGAPAPAGAAPSPAEARVDSALTLETGNDGLEKPSSPAQADVQTRQAPPQFTDCPPAVAALGLCNPDTKQEGH